MAEIIILAERRKARQERRATKRHGDCPFALDDRLHGFRRCDLCRARRSLTAGLRALIPQRNSPVTIDPALACGAPNDGLCDRD